MNIALKMYKINLRGCNKTDVL